MCLKHTLRKEKGTRWEGLREERGGREEEATQNGGLREGKALQSERGDPERGSELGQGLRGGETWGFQSWGGVSTHGIGWKDP